MPPHFLGTAVIVAGLLLALAALVPALRNRTLGTAYWVGVGLVQEHADLINSVRDGKPLNEMKRIAETTLTAIMGRMSAYTGKLVTWEKAMESKLDLWPQTTLAFGPWPTPPIAMPGKDPLI